MSRRRVVSTTATTSHLLKTVFVLGRFCSNRLCLCFRFDLVFVSTPFSISSWGTTEIDLVLLCLSLAATSQMHAHDVCVLSLLRLWNCGSIDAIVGIKNETAFWSLKWNLASRRARLAFFRLQSVGPFGLAAWDSTSTRGESLECCLNQFC